MSWFRTLRTKLSSSTDETVSRRQLFAGAGVAAGGLLLAPEAGAMGREIEPGTLVDAQGRPVSRESASADPILGQLMLFGGNFAPRGWATCAGQLLAISSNNALFSLLGTIYGGDGRTTFALPDLRGRSPIGQGNGPGFVTISWGQRGGAETTTLNALNLPSHGHTPTMPQVQVRGAGTQVVGVTTGGEVNSAVAVGSTTSAGNGQSFNHRSPFLGMYWCIAIQGVFPSRN